MLSPLMSAIIFLQITSQALCLAGFYNLFKKYLRQKDKLSLYASLIFLTGFASITFVFTAQMLFNWGLEGIIVDILYKCIFWGLIFVILFASFYALEFFQVYSLGIKMFIFLFSLLLIILTFFSNIKITYRNFSLIPSAPLSLILGIASLGFLVFIFSLIGYLKKIKEKEISESERRIINLLVWANVFAFALLGSLALYCFTNNLWFYFIFKVFMLAVIVVFFLASVTPKDDPYIKRAFDYLRRRIFYKLTFIFVALIVIALQSISWVFLNVAKVYFSEIILNNERVFALSVAQKVEKEEINIWSRKKIINETKNIFLLSKEGLFLYPSVTPFKNLAQEINDQKLRQEILWGTNGAFEFINSSGEPMVGAYAQIIKKNAVVLVTQPMKEAYIGIRRMETISFLIVVLGIVVTYFVGFFFVRSLEKPIKKLTAGTEQLKEGNLDVKVLVDSIDEIGELAAAFNQMTLDLKRAREGLEWWNQELEFLVNKRTADLQESNRLLKEALAELKTIQDKLVESERLAAMGKIAAVTAHEIKNPLTSIMALIKMCPTKYNDQQFREMFESIVPVELERLNSLSLNLLGFAKFSEAVFAPADVNAVLKDAVDLIVIKSYYNVNLTCDFPNLPLLFVDKNQLKQVFINLLTNALDAMPHGGELKVCTAKEDDQVRITISDSGCGIAPELADKVFESFFSTKKMGQGTGLGLWVSKRIVEEHGGTISFKSEVNRGSTFYIILPLQR